MKTKSEITLDYITLISDINKNIVSYESYLNKKYTAICDSSKGNRGIQEIEDELVNMKKIVSDMIKENEELMTLIKQNEHKF